MHVQKFRLSGQSEVKPQVFSSQASLVPIYPPTEGMTHPAEFSRRSLADVGLSESVRCHGPGLALLTNGGVQHKIT
ncbi:hypothetical protein TNCV_3669701 [Trichonephila clavipes]|nr:hypothetical protein TNCV_3669701 [Trichonephila clavipes]